MPPEMDKTVFDLYNGKTLSFLHFNPFFKYKEYVQSSLCPPLQQFGTTSFKPLHPTPQLGQVSARKMEGPWARGKYKYPGGGGGGTSPSGK